MRFSPISSDLMSLEKAKEKLCEQAKLLSEPCEPELLSKLYRSHHPAQQHEEFLAQQSKNAIIYVMVVVIFYVAVVVLLVGTNLNSGRGAKFKQHVVEYREGEGAKNKIVSVKKQEQCDDV